MGLDMYLYVKRPHENGKGLVTGACGGLFGIVPDVGEGTEIGYWRKFYALDKYLGYGRGDKFSLTEDEITDVIELAKSHIEAYNATKDIEDIDYDYFYDEYGFEPDFEEDIWEWKNTLEIFEKALELKLNEDAEVIYLRWY